MSKLKFRKRLCASNLSLLPYVWIYKWTAYVTLDFEVTVTQKELNRKRKLEVNTFNTNDIAWSKVNGAYRVLNIPIITTAMHTNVKDLKYTISRTIYAIHTDTEVLNKKKRRRTNSKYLIQRHILILFKKWTLIVNIITDFISPTTWFIACTCVYSEIAPYSRI